MKLIHLSDLHIRKHESSNKDVIMLFDYIEENFKDHYLVITGDITDDGDERQYVNAYGILKRFEERLFICPGNHDFGAVGNYFSLERARRFDSILSLPLNQNGSFAGDNTPVVNTLKEDGNETIIIALDTNLETENAFDFACGMVGGTQLKYLDTILSDPSIWNMTKVIIMHHHPFIHNNPYMELKDAESFIRTIYQRVDLVLFGHKHESNMWKNRYGIKYILASDNSPGKDFAREIIIENNKNILVNDIKIK